MTTTSAVPRLPRLLDINDPMALMRLGRTATYARTREPDFALVLSDGCYRWWGHEVEAWLESRRMQTDRKTARAAAPAAAPTVDVTMPAPTPVVKRTRVAA